MTKPTYANLTAMVMGHDMSAYQKSLAWAEFQKMVEYIEYNPTPDETRRKAFDEVMEKLSDYAENTQFAIEILTEDIPDFKTE